MPLWRIFCNPATFTTDQKAALAKSITPLYTNASLPAFYVNVVFIPIESDSFYIGGDPQSNMVRIAIEHIAIHQPESERSKMLDGIDELLQPHIAARGDLNWEYHVCETPRDLWRIQGLNPPPWHSEEEKIWARENEASVWEKGELKGKM